MPLIEHVNDDRHTSYLLAGGVTLGISKPPQTKEAAEVREVVRRSLDVLGCVDAVRRDETLSEVGKAQRLKALEDLANTVRSQAVSAVADFADYVAKDEVETFTPPQLDKADAVSGLIDMELRTMVRAMDSKERAELGVKLLNEPRLVEAILRSPLDMGPLTLIARNVWADQVKATNPHAGEVKRAREALEWAQATLPAILNHFPEPPRPKLF